MEENDSKRKLLNNCEQHFASDFIIHVNTIARDDDSILSMPRTLLTLSHDAFPSYFSNAPSYLSIEPPVKRKLPDSRRAELEAREDHHFEEYISADSIKG